MVDVSSKGPLRRTAVAEGTVTMSPNTATLVRRGLLKKGDALSVARIAGIMAAKRTSELIPLCHNLPLDNVAVDLAPGKNNITIRATAVCTGRTGVEMEALTAVSVAALAVYDMCKAADKKMVISRIRLIEKTKVPLT